MGCDIHAIVEYEDLGDMTMFAKVRYLPRNYDVFAAMAGVRNHRRGIVPVSSPRGLPPRMDADTREWVEEDCVDHSHSWLTADEFDEALRRADAEHPEYMAVLAMMRALGPTARIVFGFDN